MDPKTTFADGLGERRHTTGTGNQPLDVLILHEELTSVPTFESAVRERVDQLSAFQHRSFARIRGVGRLAKAPARLAIASDHVEGVRLSELLAVAEKRLIPLEIAATFCLLRQIVAPVAALHEKAPDAAHGSIGPERIVVTRDGRVVIVEHVLGAALEQLRFSHDRYWKELRIPVPLTGGLPRFDRRGDVTQIGAVALALVLGRPLGEEEYPSRISDIVDGVRAISANGLETLPAPVRSWLSRALQLDPRRSFATALEAQTEFEALPQNEAQGREALEAFLSQCHASLSSASAPAASAPATAPLASPAPPPPVLPAPAAETASVPVPVPIPAHVPRSAPVAAEPVRAVVPLGGRSLTEAHDSDDDEPADDGDDVVERRGFRLPSMRAAWVAVAVGVIALASVGTLAARGYWNDPAMGTLAIDTNPAGAEVLIDGQKRGVTPLNIELSAGPHTLEIPTSEGPRTIPVTIPEGGQVAQFIELPKTAPSDGQLQVRSEPPGATVSVDGERRGVAPITIPGLKAGPHTVVLENTLGSVTESVTIQAGTTASLVVPLTAPQGAPVSGWISVSSPIEVQIYENKQLLGSSRSERLMVSAGKHELEIANEALGYRTTRTVQVTPGKVSPIRVEAPKGSMSFNAQPWADVWLDGERLGETPIGNVMVPIGEHSVVFRNPELGEQRYTVMVTLTAPARVSADLRKR
jgi:hypothetical protein